MSYHGMLFHFHMGVVIGHRSFLLPYSAFNHLSANPTKWSNTLKQFFGKLPTNCLSVFDHFVRLALKGLKHFQITEAATGGVL